VLLNLGTVYSRLKKKKEAREAWSRFLELASPDDPMRPKVEDALKRMER
jgi:cytochrome c-type biogenesis protein CcmH/NrfG